MQEVFLLTDATLKCLKLGENGKTISDWISRAGACLPFKM